MKTLTLEHLAPYLPYGLKARIEDFKCDYVGREFDLIIGFHQWDKSGKLWSVLTEGGAKPSIDKIKPILRPLSDLTKEIEHNGEKVNVQYLIDEIRLEVETYEYIDSTYDIELNIETADYSQSIDLFEGYRMVEILLKYHFDVFGLINKGLAIDINTLEK